MSILSLHILGGENNTPARVSSNGELLTRLFDYSESESATVNVVDTAFCLYAAKPAEQFVVTGASVSGNRDIGVNGSIFELYGDVSAEGTTIVQSVLSLEVPKNSVFPFLLPNVLLKKGLFLNAKADDDVVRVSVFGYYVPEVPE